jgi:hypothetical protein
LRGFPSDLSLTGNPVPTLQVLTKMNQRTGSISKSLTDIHEKTFSEQRLKAKKDENVFDSLHSHPSTPISQKLICLTKLVKSWMMIV